MGAWTLEYGGVEKTLAEWGLSEQQVTRQCQNMAADTVTLRAPGALEGALKFAYGQAVIIRRDRTGVGPFAAGTIFFRGKAGLPQRSGSGREEEIAYSFYGPWWDFTRLVMQQAWNEFAGWTIPGDPTSDPTYTVRRTSELFLGQAIDGTRLNTGEQIAEAVNWAATCGVAVQVGTIDPATNIPIYNTRDITVSEVIVQMARWTPDVVCWFDYTTTPPTFHCRKLANLATVDVTADGAVAEVSLTPRYDLQLAAVCLRFKATNVVDGRPSVVVWSQNAPVNATGQELGASVHTVELMGSQSDNVYADLVCTAATPCLSATAADRLAWWRRKDPLLLSEYMDLLALPAASVLDEAGNATTLVARPNELVSGSVAEWMTVGGAPVTEAKVTIKATMTYDLYRVPVRRNAGVLEVYANGSWTSTKADKFLVEKGRKEEVSANIRVTNGTTGSYSALASYEEGESVPANLAADIYAAHQPLSYEGTLSWVGSEVPTGIGVGQKVDLLVGAVTYEGLMVQGVVEDLGAGRLTVSFGPASHLGVSDLIELLRVNRNRLVINNPRTRTTGTVSGGASVTLGKATARENTTAGLGDRVSFTVHDAAEGQLVRMDGTEGALVIEGVGADGAPAEGVGSILLKLSEAAGEEIKLREWDVCVVENGVQVTKKALFLSSAAYAA